MAARSNHFRIRSLIDVGAWDEWNVTEDADLGIRLARFGYRVRALNSDTSEEAPHELKNWFRQRVRWQKGWMQTLIVHSRQPSLFRRDLGPSRALAATTLIGGAIVGCLFWPVFALLTLWRALTVGDDGALAPVREMTDVFTYILALAGRLDDRAPRFDRRAPSRLKAELARARADAGLLHAGDAPRPGRRWFTS